MIPSWPVVAVAAAVGIGIGAAGATWRSASVCADKTQVLTDKVIVLSTEKHQLELAVVEQNKGVAIAEAQTRAADAAKLQAQRHAEDMAQFSQSRLDRLATAVTKASTCGDVLQSYWEMRK
jgi:hypothetical protein